MTLTVDQKKAESFINSLIAKAWSDEQFKSDLVKSPRETIARFKGSEVTLPEGVSINVNDQTNTSVFYFNIPPKPNLDNLELSDEQLEMVAGGEVAISSAAVTWAVSGLVVGVVAGAGLWYAAANW